MKKIIRKRYWFFPIMYFFMVLLTMNEHLDGIDFKNQIYTLESIKDTNIQNLPNNLNDAYLYLYTYKVLYNICGISPRLFIALLSFIYFAILIKAIECFVYKYEVDKLNKSRLGQIALFTCLCYSPLFICIARFHFAVILVLIGLLILLWGNTTLKKILGITILISSYFAHQGISIIYALIILAYLLHRFWLSKSTNVINRNIIICLISLVLFITGPKVFGLVTALMGRYSLLSDRYVESYVETTSGDGLYLLVLVLSLLGTMVSLMLTTLCNRKNNWITALCVSGIFMTCLFYNQKFFFVQRIFMFMPLFIGLSVIQVIQNENSKKVDLLKIALFSVPAIYLCQLWIQRLFFFTCRN